jgi:hypothetical protein
MSGRAWGSCILPRLVSTLVSTFPPFRPPRRRHHRPPGHRWRRSACPTPRTTLPTPDRPNARSGIGEHAVSQARADRESSSWVPGSRERGCRWPPRSSLGTRGRATARGSASGRSGFTRRGPCRPRGPACRSARAAGSPGYGRWHGTPVRAASAPEGRVAGRDPGLRGGHGTLLAGRHRPRGGRQSGRARPASRR